MTTATAKAIDATVSSRHRYSGPTAPNTGTGCSAAAAAMAKRPGSTSHRRMKKIATKGTDGQGEQPPEPERRLPSPVDHGGEPRAHAVAGGDERDGLGAVRRAGLLGRADLGHGVGGAQQRAPQGEDDHEPPVPGAGRGQDGERRARRAHVTTSMDAPAERGRPGPPGEGRPARPGAGRRAPRRARCPTGRPDRRSVVPCTTRPKCLATSPNAATAPNCPNPEARAMSARATTAGSDHERSPRSPWVGARRSSARSLSRRSPRRGPFYTPASPAGRDAVATAAAPSSRLSGASRPRTS